MKSLIIPNIVEIAFSFEEYDENRVFFKIKRKHSLEN